MDNFPKNLITPPKKKCLPADSALFFFSGGSPVPAVEVLGVSGPPSSPPLAASSTLSFSLQSFFFLQFSITFFRQLQQQDDPLLLSWQQLPQQHVFRQLQQQDDPLLLSWHLPRLSWKHQYFMPLSQLISLHKNC